MQDLSANAFEAVRTREGSAESTNIRDISVPVPGPLASVWALFNHVVAFFARAPVAPVAAARHHLLEGRAPHRRGHSPGDRATDSTHLFGLRDDGVLAGRRTNGGDGPPARPGNRSPNDVGRAAPAKDDGQEGLKSLSDAGQETGARTGLTNTGREESTVVTHRTSKCTFGNGGAAGSDIFERLVRPNVRIKLAGVRH